MPIEFEGLERDYANSTMAHINADVYHMMDHDRLHYFAVDVKAMIAEKKRLSGLHGFINLIVNRDLAIGVRASKSVLVLKAGVRIGVMNVKGKKSECNNKLIISNRWVQQNGDDVYMIDYCNYLYTIKWSDVHQGRHDWRRVDLQPTVADFCCTTAAGLAYLRFDGEVCLPFGKTTRLDTVKCDPKWRWTILTRAAKHWIVSGDLDGQAIIASINGSGKVKSNISLRLTSNDSRSPSLRGHQSIYSITPVFDRHRRAIVMVVERLGSIHLISISMTAKLSICSSVAASFESTSMWRTAVLSVNQLRHEGQFIIGGKDWNKLICLKLK